MLKYYINLSQCYLRVQIRPKYRQKSHKKINTLNSFELQENKHCGFKLGKLIPFKPG